MGQVSGRRVETVEALAGDDGPSALQAAFLATGGAQCGACTPGMLLAARDLLARTAEPSDGEIRGGLGGVLCRCTGYQAILGAARAAAAGPVAPALRPDAGEAVGARVARTDGLEKVTGSERFGDDLPDEGAWHLRAVRSPHARARFRVGDLGPVF